MKVGKMPTLKWLKVDDIRIPEGRLKSHIENHEDFEESIKAEGVIQPIYVFEEEGQNGKSIYWLADGGNRLEVAKRQDKPIIQAYVLHGSMEDALLYSAKLNVHRGRYNIGELCEFVKRFKDKGMKGEEIAENLKLSKSYISQLLTIAENPEIVEKLKKGLISKEEAYKSCKSLLSKPVSEETRYKEKPSETLTVETPRVEPAKPLTDQDLGLTSNLREAMEGKAQFKPLGPEDLKPQESKKTEYMTCDYCGRILSRVDARYLRVHSEEYDKVLLAIKKLAEAERETRNGSSQP
jgi:ParB/RepB/Spo0J family partition protein